MFRVLKNTAQKSQALYIVMVFATVLVVGLADYLTSTDISFAVFYLLAVAPAVWFVGSRFGVFVSVLSVTVWLVGVLGLDAFNANPLAPLWNAMITLAFYLTVVWLLARLRLLQNELEERVRQRTQALTTEMAEREHLSREILHIAERERQRIGREIHDDLGQHLTATAMAGQVLHEKLAAKSMTETADASCVVQMVERAIKLSRQLVIGLSPIEMTGEGLVHSLHELASGIEERHHIQCRLNCKDTVLINDPAVGLQLYRIAQEAVNNAVKHAKASSIMIRVSCADDAITLSVQDDGVGLPQPLPKDGGMGLHIMAHRADMIGALLSLRRRTEGGTMVTCTFRGRP